MKYIVNVQLKATYDDIEADSEEEAFQIASDAAIQGGDWYYSVKPFDEEEGAE